MVGVGVSTLNTEMEMPDQGFKRICFLLRVKPERLEEYKRRHADVWPEMRQALSDAGWHNYSLFLCDDGLLIGYLETRDFEQALARMARSDVNRKWQREMTEFFDGAPGRFADEQMAPIPEIFHLP
jgi:L-rhamnose mutarotase